MLPRPHHDVVVPIAVHVAGPGGSDAEPFAGRLAGRHEDRSPVPARKDVTPAGRGAFGRVGEVGHEDVLRAVGIHVTDDRKEHPAECRAGLVGILHETGRRGEPVVDVDPPALLRAAADLADEQVLPVCPGHRRAEPAIGRLAVQREQARSVLAGEHVCPARRRPRGGARRCAGHDVGVAVAVEVADARRTVAEPLVRRIAAEPQQLRAVPAGVDDDRQDTRCASHDIGYAIPVHIARRLEREAEPRRRITCLPPERAAGPAGIDEDLPAPVAGRRVGGRGDGDVVHAVAVHVAYAARDPPEFAAHDFATPLVDHPDLFVESPGERGGIREQHREALVTAKLRDLGVADDRREVESHGPDLAEPARGLVGGSGVGGEQEELERGGPPRGRDRARLFIRLQGGGGLAEPAPGPAQRQPRRTIVGRRCHHALEHSRRRVELARRHQVLRQRNPGRGSCLLRTRGGWDQDDPCGSQRGCQEPGKAGRKRCWIWHRLLGWEGPGICCHCHPTATRGSRCLEIGERSGIHPRLTGRPSLPSATAADLSESSGARKTAVGASRPWPRSPEFRTPRRSQ